jgi:predicted transcriptional regulator
MKLKILNLEITTREFFLNDVKKALTTLENTEEQNNTFHFDTLETIKKILTTNKIEILMAISRLRPQSINQLAKMLNREYPHVLKDCHTLELQGFISLIQSEGARKQFIPKLAFDYDIIRVNSIIEEIIPISEKSNQVLLAAY